MDEVIQAEDSAARIAAGLRLRALRLARMVDGHPTTLAEAGALVGVGKNTWKKWESGTEPAASRAVAIAERFGTTVAAIWGRHPLPESADEGDDDVAAANAQPAPVDVDAPTVAA